MEKQCCDHIRSEDLSWQPHPVISGARVAYLMPSTSKNGSECALVDIPAGAEAKPHVHQCHDDVLYVLRGRATMWVEGQGEIALEPGCFLRIRSGVWHCPNNILETLLVYNTWIPAHQLTCSQAKEKRS